ncbi:MAG TPA: sulfonate ABC transporter ATP-binding protein [Curvibacter sp.]|nr:sulfonate ABC transporter ATP-binding protein [Curvibacter sp.]|tara:strand:- start:404 stop:1135 length:732 start_codon:yes stop_codon:yes gene_type:complete
MSQLHIQVAHKRYGARTVLEGVNLRVERGEIVSLIGASGCGKSTLLRIVSGLDRDYQGVVQLDGRKLDGVTREIGFIFQEPRLLPWLHVADNIAFDIAHTGYNLTRVQELLEEVDLAGYEQALPKQLSGGQAQRVAIARGLYSRPKVLLLDEPFSAVDAFTRIRLQNLLARIARDHGITVLLVTHDVDEAVFLSDRVLVIGGTPGTVLSDLEIVLPHPREHESADLLQQRGIVFEALHTAHVL